MRIDRLHLKAYGRFDNCELDLSGPGLVVVHGSNEAGKTTALNAIGDWLFGFERITSYDFLHKSSELRVGGTLRQLADSLIVYRRKGNRDTLRGESEQPLADALLKPYCGTITRAQFEGSFGLTHERLRIGGKELRENRGELAQALFSAASGLTSLRRWQEVLKSNREKLYKPSGQIPELNKALSECKAAKLAIRTDAIPIEDVREQASRISKHSLQHSFGRTGIQRLSVGFARNVTHV